MKEPTVQKIIKDMEARFKSGNEVPVERAHIKREEWNALKQALLQPKSNG